MGGDLSVSSPWRLHAGLRPGRPAAGGTRGGTEQGGEQGGTEFAFTLVLPVVRGDQPAQERSHPASPSALAPLIAPRPPAPASAPAAAPDPQPPPCPAQLSSLPSQLNVLLADDVNSNLVLLSKVMVKYCGHDWRVERATTSEGALKLFEEKHGGEDGFGLVVIDEHFDVRSNLLGSVATKQMRAFEAARGGARAVIIACTGNTSGIDYAPAVGAEASAEAGDPTRAAHYFECGADALWGKPLPDFSDGTMQASLARLLAQSPPESRTSGESFTRGVAAEPEPTSGTTSGVAPLHAGQPTVQ